MIKVYLFEKVDHGDGAISLEHIKRTLLGRLGAAREPVQVQGDGTKEIILKKTVRILLLMNVRRSGSTLRLKRDHSSIQTNIHFRKCSID